MKEAQETFSGVLSDILKNEECHQGHVLMWVFFQPSQYASFKCDCDDSPIVPANPN